MTDYWATIGLAALIAVVVSALVAVWGGTRSIHFQAVIAERKSWRDDLRSLVPDLLDDTSPISQRHLRNEIFLRLNPNQDVDAMRLIDDYLAHPTIERQEQVVEHFQQYLKFEWTRAKIEASWFPYFADVRSHRRITRQRRRK